MSSLVSNRGLTLNARLGAARPWAAVLLRLVVGCGFVAHGMAKLGRGPAGFGRLLAHIGAPSPVVTAWVVTLLELFGGVALVAGAFVVVAAVPLAATMLVAMFTVHWRYGFSSVNTVGLSPDGPVFGPPGYEVNLLYVGALAAIAVSGAGPFSVDRWRESRASPDEPAGSIRD